MLSFLSDSTSVTLPLLKFAASWYFFIKNTTEKIFSLKIILSVNWFGTKVLHPNLHIHSVCKDFLFVINEFLELNTTQYFRSFYLYRI